MFFILDKIMAKIFEKDGNKIVVDDNAETSGMFEGYTDLGAAPVVDTTEDDAREKRNNILAETDWWAVTDRTMTDDQTAYRQALRDITTHANWPDLDDVDWPTKPN